MLCGIEYAVAAARFGITFEGLRLCVLFALLAAAALTDLRKMEIPDSIPLVAICVFPVFLPFEANPFGALVNGIFGAVAIAALILPVCIFGISSAMRSVHAVITKSTADALADAAAQHIKNEIRFARDPDAAVESLTAYTATLGDLSTEALTFEKSPNGAVSFRFHVAGFSYAYETMPLNRDFVPNSGAGFP